MNEALETKESRVYRVEEAAKLAGVSKAAFYRAVKLRQVPYLRLSGRILIPKRAFDELLAGTARFEGLE